MGRHSWKDRTREKQATHPKKTSRHTKTGRGSEAGRQRSTEKSGHPNTRGHPEMEHMVRGVWVDPGLGETVAWRAFQAEGFPEAQRRSGAGDGAPLAGVSTHYPLLSPPHPAGCPAEATD